MGYSKEWWAANRERVLKERAERYRKDPNARALSAERTRRYRQRKRERENKGPPMVPYGGGEVEGHDLERVMSATGLTEARILYLYRIGHTPPPPVSRPKRLWGAPHIALLIEMDAWLRENQNKLNGIRKGGEPSPIELELQAKIEDIAQRWEG